MDGYRKYTLHTLRKGEIAHPFNGVFQPYPVGLQQVAVLYSTVPYEKSALPVHGCGGSPGTMSPGALAACDVGTGGRHRGHAMPPTSQLEKMQSPPSMFFFRHHSTSCRPILSSRTIYKYNNSTIGLIGSDGLYSSRKHMRMFHFNIRYGPKYLINIYTLGLGLDTVDLCIC